MKNLNIRSYCKINLSLKVLQKLNNGYHNIISLVTFCEPYDLISITKTKNFKDKIIFFGKFKKGINKKSNTVSKVLDLLRRKKLLQNQKFKIKIKKNIPHGSGLGGASSNAADLINFFNKNMKLNLKKNKLIKLASEIGFDTPISLERKNTLITGKWGEMIRLKKKLKLNLLIVYPNLICSTKKIYIKNRKNNLFKKQPLFHKKNNKQLIDFLINENNDLEKTVVKIYPRIKNIINFIYSQKGCYLSRITGSGSACIGIFSNMKNAVYAKKSIKLKYPKYWCTVSKTI